jgi:hypothetical protein
MLLEGFAYLVEARRLVLNVYEIVAIFFVKYLITARHPACRQAGKN